MSDFSDDEDVAEELNDEVLGDEYPPDRYVDPDDPPGDPLPEVGETDDQQRSVQVLAEADPDVEGDSVGEAVYDDEYGALSDDDEFSGDETTRDVATERVPPPAEEVALHVEDDGE